MCITTPEIPIEFLHWVIEHLVAVGEQNLGLAFLDLHMATLNTLFLDLSFTTFMASFSFSQWRSSTRCWLVLGLKMQRHLASEYACRDQNFNCIEFVERLNMDEKLSN